MKRLILTLGTVAAVAAPIASVVACSSTNKDETYRGSLKHDLKILTLGDSVAHGDYTFQMSGSGTPFMPMLDGPARAASYQDYLFDEFQRDGLMNENDRPNYRTSASGLRSGELAEWLKPGGTYLKGVAAANTVDASATPEEKQLSKDQIEYHRHPYTNGAGTKTWWADGLTDDKGAKVDMPDTVQSTPQPVAYADITKEQQDQMTMKEHVKESNVVLITIGGNDILKDIMVMGHPFNRMGDVTSWTDEIVKLVTGVLPKLATLSPGIARIVGAIQKAQPQLAALMGATSGIKTQLLGLLTGKVNAEDLLVPVMKVLDPVRQAVNSLNKADVVAFDKWFLGEGHKALIQVNQKMFDASLEEFKTNIGLISDRIHAMNPDAKVIFTGYPSPLMHFPKIFRNLAMPYYGKIAETTENYAKTAKDVYFAPSSLENWETDDPTDIYDNILTDPHPTLEGQGIMAKDILKVIDKIYGLNAKLTDKELKAQTADEVESHKLTGPKMTVAERNAALADGSYKYPYQTNKNPKYNADIDYTYNVKPLPIEELTHAKVYFSSRIGMFLIDAITDSIKLNPSIKNPGDQSVPHSGTLTLSDLTKKWGENYAASKTADRFIRTLSPDFIENVLNEFESSLSEFTNVFITKINGVISADHRVEVIKNLLSMMN